MDLYKDGVICTKNKLWKKTSTILAIVDDFISKGYTFKEMVYGEPNDFVFATTYDKIIPKLKVRGTFVGIRLKFEYRDAVVTIFSNTRGIDNVGFQVFAEDKDTLSKVANESIALKTIIKPSNNSFAKLSEYIANHKQIRTVFVIVAVIAAILLVNTFVPIISMVSSIFMFAPLIFIYIFFAYFRRR